MQGTGKFIHSNGEVYEGEFVNDKANGYGKFERESGEIYMGYWVDDKPHGNGTQVL